jgi:hypothetical protein
LFSICPTGATSAGSHASKSDGARLRRVLAGPAEPFPAKALTCLDRGLVAEDVARLSPFVRKHINDTDTDDDGDPL